MLCGPMFLMSRSPISAIVVSISFWMIVERAGHARLAAGAEPIGHRAADEGALGAERQRLEHVLAGADAAIHEDLGLVADRIDDLGQHPDGRWRAVELAAAVVGDDDRVGAVVDRELRILRVEDALDHHRPAEPLLDPGDVLPVERQVELRRRPLR